MSVDGRTCAGVGSWGGRAPELGNGLEKRYRPIGLERALFAGSYGRAECAYYAEESLRIQGSGR